MEVVALAPLIVGADMLKECLEHELSLNESPYNIQYLHMTMFTVSFCLCLLFIEDLPDGLSATFEDPPNFICIFAAEFFFRSKIDSGTGTDP